MAYRSIHRTVLAKIEATPGTDAAPVVGTDAVLVEDPTVGHELGPQDTNEVTASLDARAPVVGGGGGTFAATVNLKGSGAGGTAPEWGVLMRGCGFAETLLASDVSGTAQASGNTASAINLALGDGASVAIGEVIELTGGAGSGQARVITGISTDVASVYPDFTTTPDGTTTYAVKACALYVPASTGLKNLTLYDYQHNADAAVNSRLRKILGWMGTVAFTFPTRGVVQAAFSGRGQFQTPTDVAAPAAPTYDTTRPIALMNADVSLNNVTTKFNQLTLDAGVDVQLADDPGNIYGVDVADAVRRRITGRINPPLSLLSVRNVFADFVNGTDRKFWTRYGTVAGNKISLYAPALRYSGQEAEDVNGLAHEGIPFSAQGEDTGMYLCVY